MLAAPRVVEKMSSGLGIDVMSILMVSISEPSSTIFEFSWMTCCMSVGLGSGTDPSEKNLLESFSSDIKKRC